MGSESDSQSLLRWYIDTRPLTASTTTLPLLDTLQPSDQETVKKYYHLKDKHMSLASYLLKYLFIHRTCRIPWDKITISRTPPPHHRPCFIPSLALTTDNPKGLPTIEFNVSHQASLIALAGTTTPASSPNPTASSSPNPSTTPTPSTPQLGIDITCVNERRSTDTTQQTRPALEEFVDIFSEVFSQRELQTIKNAAAPTPGRSESDAVAYAFRLFYTYWALKEAYIKMTGEALLAPWLRELEFLDVVAPDPPAAGGGGASSLECGVPYTGVRTLLYGQRVADVRIEVVALGEDYLIATAARGGRVGSSSGGVKPDVWLGLKPVDIEGDVGPCARGLCRCLE
ncbi:hypothetical protein P168DRAFT_272258 [Aspergillus campestris IBT 28561]|uniref:holo-[acyl-carrier-protein] synthase n=1 Tax=Aspergillus campestris (strain IBT 28561) TaxID=1392248 RepID=A0A2I1CYQ0_ASPC2|nr:uncharacterized protein P168DRAFT_272258 [Aspergillus campestris IBT 28561]PKY02759.1 hypothetical protein P168DRAFT_272258 [Aspergillus campestris IBT 28561]